MRKQIVAAILLAALFSVVTYSQEAAPNGLKSFSCTAQVAAQSDRVLVVASVAGEFEAAQPEPQFYGSVEVGTQLGGGGQSVGRKFQFSWKSEYFHDLNFRPEVKATLRNDSGELTIQCQQALVVPPRRSEGGRLLPKRPTELDVAEAEECYAHWATVPGQDAPAVLGLQPEGSDLTPFFEAYGSIPAGQLILAGVVGDAEEVLGGLSFGALQPGAKIRLPFASKKLAGDGLLRLLFVPNGGFVPTILEQNVTFPLSGPQGLREGDLRVFGERRVALIRVDPRQPGPAAGYLLQYVSPFPQAPIVVFAGRVIPALRPDVDFAVATGMPQGIYLGVRELDPALTPRGVVTIKVGSRCGSRFLDVARSDLLFDRR